MSELGLTPYGAAFALPYSDSENLSNLIGVAPGTDRSAEPVVIGAHHDTVSGTPGADDNAAAVAIALEVAARLVARPAARDVVIGLFDGEEPPYFHGSDMGSTHFYDHQRKGGVHAAVVLDLVGHAVPVTGLEDLVVITGMESDPALEKIVRGLGSPPGLTVVTALNRYVGDVSDHHVFRLNQVPYLFLSCGHWQHYHRLTDTPDRLDYDKMALIADAVETLVREAANTDLGGPWEGYDTTTTDLETMRAAFGPFLAQQGLTLNGREDIVRAVHLLTSSLGL